MIKEKKNIKENKRIKDKGIKEKLKRIKFLFSIK
jgi:hypothetical protein